MLGCPSLWDTHRFRTRIALGHASLWDAHLAKTPIALGRPRLKARRPSDAGGLESWTSRRGHPELVTRRLPARGCPRTPTSQGTGTRERQGPRNTDAPRHGHLETRIFWTQVPWGLTPRDKSFETAGDSGREPWNTRSLKTRTPRDVGALKRRCPEAPTLARHGQRGFETRALARRGRLGPEARALARHGQRGFEARTLARHGRLGPEARALHNGVAGAQGLTRHGAAQPAHTGAALYRTVTSCAVVR
ncbi:hypothetical protein J2853_007142 [Streptosporangium lutulentum]|uniref:Uncharacterized protein n=1 Tax=Streptosporangium lutulentum TaxID=1461250 RepID=A0ABT9QME7_9ACTN|nr:hypothetical protein [Streptosporangium lutulentum]